MPTYEYVCNTCKTPLEVVQSIHEPSLTDCPSCPDGRLRKVFGNVGVVFKGSGFYRTDSREKPAAAAKAGSKAKPEAESRSEAATESSTSGDKAGSAAPGSGSASADSGSPGAAKPAGKAAPAKA